MLEFTSESHEYKYGGLVYSAVSTVIASFKIKFDSDFWSTYKALEQVIGVEDFKEMKRIHGNFKTPQFIEWACSVVDIDELQDATNDILARWDKERINSIDKGNAYHLAKEKQAYSRGYEINPFTKSRTLTIGKKPVSENKSSKVINLYDLADGYYPELMIWNNNYCVAGTADKVFIETIGNIRFIDVDDYKSNKKIDTNNPWEKMKYPLESLDNCNYNHYRIQICTYAWMLEQFGFKPRNTAFTHLNKQYNFSYGHMRKKIDNMMNFYKNKITT